MDKKISEFVAASTLLGNDIIPIVSAGVNKSISAGLFGMNLPNFGNKGISKNVVTPVMTNTIPVSVTLCVIPTNLLPYTIPNGVDGQEITIISTGNNSITLSNGYISVINMVAGSSLTLTFITSIGKWIPKSYHGISIV
jgi:hypothetical protein